MRSIAVCASKCYHVIIGSGLLKSLGTHVLSSQPVCKVALVTDSNVAPLYADIAFNSLTDAGYDVATFVFPAGESHKNCKTYLEILNFLSENEITRSDLIIALGGGVVGDITGFAAATYLRGISYIQVPTTLLAMVDSSVGGKTAIDLPAGKNLVGAFYQPDMVLCDTDTLETLPNDVFRDGCAEVIKYGVLFDPQLFSHLADRGIEFHRESVIAACVEWKSKVVSDDEFDTGLRQKLNLGHTIGHSIEAKSDFTVPHGHAVAMGMSIVAKAAAGLGYSQQSTYLMIEDILRKFDLPSATEYTAKQLYPYVLSDKKRSGNNVSMIIPKSIGDCAIQKVPVAELESFIEAGLL